MQKKLYLSLLISLLIPALSYPKSAQINSGPATVNVITVVPQNYQPSLSASGTLSAVQGTILKAEAEGRVIAIEANSGQTVSAGQALVQINPGILTGQLKANQADLALQQVTYSRYQKLFAAKGLSKEDLDTAKANFLKAEGNAEQTQAALDKTLVKAPFAGNIGILKVNLGDYVTVGQPIVSIQNTDPIYVDFAIPEKQISQIHVGDQIILQNNVTIKAVFTGKIVALDTALDPTTRTLLVRASVPNPQHLLLPGMFATVKINTTASQASIFIPQSAVQYAPNGNYVYRVVNNKTIKTIVSLGIRQDDEILVLSGLKAGDQIVTAGLQKLHGGDEVKVLS